MEGFRVRGGEKLSGSVRVDAAKNAVLPILAASILSEEASVIEECPRISDVDSMAEILSTLGCKPVWKDGELTLHNGEATGFEMPDALSKKIRSSIFMLGPILGKMRRATVTYPGGCEIGLRPIDLHLSGLKSLGVRIKEEGGLILCDGRDMRSGDVHFDYPSVGATENVMMAAVLLKGRTTISNAAREPEIADLQAFVNAMGGKVSGAGTQTIVIEGVGKLRGARFRPMPDRIVAGTWLAAAAITGGEIELTNARPADMVAILSKLREMDCDIREEEERITLCAPRRLRAFGQLQTQPHPGFPTDMQVQLLALSTVARGTSVVVENVFENRFTHAGELSRMGANIRVSGRTAVIQGVEKLSGMTVRARDLRGGAALVLAGLRAEGETVIENAALIDRGYARMEETLAGLGAKIERMEE